jgi:hypothetical protein
LRAFGRFDETIYLVEKASDLSLPDLVQKGTSIRSDHFTKLPASLVDRPRLLSGRSPACGSPVSQVALEWRRRGNCYLGGHLLVARQRAASSA